MKLIRKAFRFFRRLTTPSQQNPPVPQLALSSKLILDEGVIRIGGCLTIGKNSLFHVGSKSNIDADIVIGDNCSITMGEGCTLKNMSFRILNGSEVTIGKGVVFNCPTQLTPTVVIDSGSLIIGDRVLIQAELLVRFGGSLNIGEYTGIGYGSEIRCEEKIQIGKYCLFSYNVCIYDTNTHSTDWQQRRLSIEEMRKYGTNGKEIPNTKPVYIGNDVWIGKDATVLKDSRIGDRCIVGIRTIVSGRMYKDDSVIVMPEPKTICRKKKSINDNESKQI